MMQQHRRIQTKSLVLRPLSGLLLPTWPKPSCLKSDSVLTRERNPSVSGLRRFPFFAAGLLRTPGFVPSASIQAFRRPSRSFPKIINPFDFVLASLGSSLAVAHASSHVTAFIEEFLKKLPSVLKGQYWAQFCVEEEHAFAADVIFPLRDASLPCRFRWTLD